MSTGNRSTCIKRQASVCCFVLVALRKALFNVTVSVQCALCSKLTPLRCHCRLYVIHRCKKLKVLDFKKVKLQVSACAWRSA